MENNPLFDCDEFEDFLDSYLDCAVWASCDDEGIPLEDRGYTSWDFSLNALEQARKDCEGFFEEMGSTMYETGGDFGDHGQDFWLSRNGHGTGFWDRGYGEVGDKLHKAAKVYSFSDVYVADDGFLYFT